MPAGFLKEGTAGVGLGAAGVVLDVAVAGGGGAAQTGEAVLVVALCAAESAVALVCSFGFVVRFVGVVAEWFWTVMGSVLFVVEGLG